MSNIHNKLLHRKEVVLEIREEKNPGVLKALNIVSGEFKVPVENIVIRRLRSGFGTDKFFVEAFLYDSVEHRNRFEQKPKPKKAKEGGA